MRSLIVIVTSAAIGWLLFDASAALAEASSQTECP